MAAAGKWNAGFCDCCSDCYSCCLTCWCPCVSFGWIAEIVDKGKTSCCAHGTLFCLLSVFHPLLAIYAGNYRTKMRRMYGIEGHQCGDCCVSYCCLGPSICQEYRELTARGFDVSAGWEENVKMHSRGATEAPAVEGGMSR